MQPRKILISSIFGAIIVLASTFPIYHSNTNILAETKKESQAVPPKETAAPEIDSEAPTTAPSPAHHKRGSITTSARNDYIDFGSKKLIDNFWGAPEEEKLTGGIYLNEDKSLGWYWDRPNPLKKPGINFHQPIYPNVRTGGCPWAPSRSIFFPIKYGEINTLEFDSEYSYLEPPTGTYDLAYDMFLTDTTKTSADPRPKAEIMIWLQYTFGQPSDTYTGDVSDGLNTYAFYSFTMANGRLYYAFLLKEQTPLKAEHKVDAKKLMDNLRLNPDWYLHGVELGNEVVIGSGAIEISKNDINLNGHHL